MRGSRNAMICLPTACRPMRTVITGWRSGKDPCARPIALPATAYTIFIRSRDPRSTVNAANLPKTCGKCHEGVNTTFAIGPVHVQTSAGPAHPAVKWIRWIYWVLIPLTLIFMLSHNLLDFLGYIRRGVPRIDGGEQVVRMNLWFRIAHWGVMLSFPTFWFTRDSP